MCVLFLGDLSEEGKRLFFLVRTAAVDSRERDRRVCPRPSTTAGRGRGEKQDGFSPLLPPLPSCPQRPAINCQAKGNRGKRRKTNEAIRVGYKSGEGRTDGRRDLFSGSLNGSVAFFLFFLPQWLKSNALSRLRGVEKYLQYNAHPSHEVVVQLVPVPDLQLQHWGLVRIFLLLLLLIVLLLPSYLPLRHRRLHPKVPVGREGLLSHGGLAVAVGDGDAGVVVGWKREGEFFFSICQWICRLLSHFRMWPPHMGPRRRPGPGG